MKRKNMYSYSPTQSLLIFAKDIKWQDVQRIGLEKRGGGGEKEEEKKRKKKRK
jgi:hypothetical protein